jgi:hypothetical protein
MILQFHPKANLNRQDLVLSTSSCNLRFTIMLDGGEPIGPSGWRCSSDPSVGIIDCAMCDELH